MSTRLLLGSSVYDCDSHFPMVHGSLCFKASPPAFLGSYLNDQFWKWNNGYRMNGGWGVFYKTWFWKVWKWRKGKSQSTFLIRHIYLPVLTKLTFSSGLSAGLPEVRSSWWLCVSTLSKNNFLKCSLELQRAQHTASTSIPCFFHFTFSEMQQWFMKQQLFTT